MLGVFHCVVHIVPKQCHPRQKQFRGMFDTINFTSSELHVNKYAWQTDGLVSLQHDGITLK